MSFCYRPQLEIRLWSEYATFSYKRQRMRSIACLVFDYSNFLSRLRLDALNLVYVIQHLWIYSNVDKEIVKLKKQNNNPVCLVYNAAFVSQK